MDTKTYPVTHTEAEWRKLLSPEQFHIMREHGTERAGSCALNYEKRAGTFDPASFHDRYQDALRALVEAKAKIETLVGNLKAAFRVRLQHLDWMSPATKVEALKKLDTYTFKVGYPDHPLLLAVTKTRMLERRLADLRRAIPLIHYLLMETALTGAGMLPDVV